MIKKLASKKGLLTGLFIVCFSSMILILAIFTRQMIFEAVNRQLDLYSQVLEPVLKQEDELMMESLQKSLDTSQSQLVVLKQSSQGHMELKWLWSNSVGSNHPKKASILTDKLSNQSSEGLVNWYDDHYFFAAKNFKVDGQLYWFIMSQPFSYYQGYRRYFLFSFILLGALLIMSFLLFSGRQSEKWLNVIEPINQALDHLERTPLYYFKEVPDKMPEVTQLVNRINRLIDDRAKVQRKYANRKSQYYLLLENINLGVMVIDNQGFIQLVNPMMDQLLGINKSAKGRSYQSVIKSSQLVHLIKEVGQTKKTTQGEIEFYVPKTIYLEVTVLPYHDSFQRPFILVLLYDISKIKRLEAIRSEFVANASHELRTPITAIKGFSETLKDGALQDPLFAKEFVDIIYKESNRLETIVEDILALSRIEKNTDNQEETVMDLVELATNIIQSLKAKLDKKEIDLVLKGDSELAYYGSYHRIEQVLTNLIDNAINYSDRGGQITVSIVSKGKYIQLTVSDNGIGIPAEDLERIFERFYRVDKAVVVILAEQAWAYPL
ncbi:histidine kinase dimerization/phospho-acceptor domain-containing protein [Facklamia hominis]|uniref:sensor histidine kinase n=1 Tax=Facklamia hominis TaxID=178214 RepID=UPI0029D414BC|nr:histidine kinase dimerization/phospho-acceptor domain-containing protein [Facklamia hominis]WPJ91039.1 histidine kinase dimerization/phospho-acceptor domain-containing protein [Facklamia hominis]